MRVKMSDYGERDEVVARTSRLARASINLWEYYVFTEHGIVAGFVGGYADVSYTYLEFVFNGRLYTRYWKRAWRQRTVARLARGMAEDIVGRVGVL